MHGIHSRILTLIACLQPEMFEIKRASKFTDRHLGSNTATKLVESQPLIDNIEDGSSSNESDNGLIATHPTNVNLVQGKRVNYNNPFKVFSGHENYDFHPLVNERLEKYEKGPHTTKNSITKDTLNGLDRFKNIARTANETMDPSKTSISSKLESEALVSPLKDVPKVSVTKVDPSYGQNVSHDSHLGNQPSNALNRFKTLAKKTSLPPDSSKPADTSNSLSLKKECNIPTSSACPPNTLKDSEPPVKPINRFKSLAKKASETNTPETGIDKTNVDSVQPLTGINRFKSLAKKTSEIDTPPSQPLNKLSNTDAPVLSGVSKFKSLAKKTSEIAEPKNDLPKLNNAWSTGPNLNINDGSMPINTQLKLPIGKENQQPPNFMTLVNTMTTVNKVSKIGRLKVRDKLKEQMKKIVEERLSVKQIFARYVEASTLHGFRYTCMDTYLIRRFFWAILMIFGFVYFLWKLDGGIREYLSYPYSTLSTLDYVDKVHFPAISICIVNQFKYSKILENPRMKELYDQGRLPLRSNWSDISHLKDIPGDVLLEDVSNVSFRLEDILKGCDYIKRDTEMPEVGKRYCAIDNFTSYYSDSGQLCYQLNSLETLDPVSFSGLRYGIDLIFDLDNNDTVMNHDFVALQVIIHDPNEPPQSNSGFMVAPGFKTYISMQRVETSNLEPPYDTQCGERPLKYFDTYNQKACLLEKLTNYTGQKCKCREPFMPGRSCNICHSCGQLENLYFTDSTRG